MNSIVKSPFYKLGLLVSILLITFIFSIFLYNVFENILFEKLAATIGIVAESSQDLEIKAMEQLKREHSHYISVGEKTLEKYGYSRGRFIFLKDKERVIGISILFSGLITLLIYINMKLSSKNKNDNIENLKVYLEGINGGDYSLDLDVDEEFSILSDELYKTIVTLRELKEQALQDKINLKDNMEDISHQLKTTITSINIMIELAESSDSKDENREYIGRLKRQAERLETLTTSLLTMSKLDANAIEFRRETVDIRNMLYLSIEPIMPLIEKRDIKLNVFGEQATIKGDSYWLGEAFLNIIKNCIEHLGDDGKIDISISSNPIFMEVMIEDNGTGFLKEDLPHLFKRFYKGENADRDSIGIGLSMARAIINEHDGEITAENRREGGARFRVKFYC